MTVTLMQNPLNLGDCVIYSMGSTFFYQVSTVKSLQLQMLAPK